MIDVSHTADLGNKTLPSGPLELNLGLYEGDLALSDPLRFHALQRALDHYKWPSQGEIILFRMSAPLKNLIRPKERFERFEEWQNDHPEGDEELFARDLLVHFLELLMPSFPEECQLSVILDEQGYDKAAFLRLAHPGRWSGLFQFQPTSNEAFLLPPADDERMSAYKEMADAAHQANISLFIPEENLPSYWAGIDRIYVSQAVSSQGLRSLKGFEAAQGEIVFLKK